MADFKRVSIALLVTTAAASLAACDGATSVASPGAGTIIVNPAPTPTPGTGTPTPTPSTPAASFAATAQGGITVTQDEQLAIFNAGANNTVNGSLTWGGSNNLVPQGAAASVTAASNTAQSAFFTNTSYIGAISPTPGDPNNTWYAGWSCTSGTLPIAGVAACNVLPTVATAATPPATVCPAGTTDAGIKGGSGYQPYRLCQISSPVTGTVTLNAQTGVAYQINGRTEVGVDMGATGNRAGGASATLNIGAGALLVSNNSDAANDFLLVNRGSFLNAIGTATAPIIFTSGQNLNNTGIGDTTQGQWGGVVLAGQAPISNCGTGSNDAAGSSTTCEAIVEGTGNALYGGPTLTSNSGTVQYVQIRYSGIEIAPGNELQGLTLAGTGSGTTVDHVQVHNSSDDGIEIFGGRTNLKYILITGADDDGMDVDVGWRGFIQFMLTVQKQSGATADSFSTEIDSNGSEDALPRTKGVYANFTFIQRGSAAANTSAVAAMRLRGGADFVFQNGIVKAPDACLNMVASTADKSTIRGENAGLQDEGAPKFNSVYFACNGL